MHGVLTAQFVAALGSFNGIDVADEIGDRYIRRRQLLDVALLRCEIRNRSLVRIVGQQLAAAAAYRRERVVVNFAAPQVREVRIKKAGERTQDAAFRLSAQSEENEVVPREDRVNNLRDDGVIIADDAGEDRAAGAYARHEIVAHLVLHAPVAHSWFGKLLAATKLTQSLRKIAQGLDTSQGHGRHPCRKRMAPNVGILRLR